ncbi:MAG: hypothetical protein R3F24_05860 [Gammaproteobacteria bacterium]
MQTLGGHSGEMGGSIGPLIYSLMLIPAEESYRYGSTYRKPFMDLVPNIGFTPDASTSRATAAANLSSGPTQQALFEMMPGDWASYQIIRDQFFSRWWGRVQRSCRTVLQFRTAWCAGLFHLLGVLLGRWACNNTPSAYWLVFAVVIYWHLLPTVRNDFSVFLKPAAFALIILAIWKLVGRFVGSAPAEFSSTPVYPEITGLLTELTSSTPAGGKQFVGRGMSSCHAPDIEVLHDALVHRACPSCFLKAIVFDQLDKVERRVSTSPGSTR